MPREGDYCVQTKTCTLFFDQRHVISQFATAMPSAFPRLIAF